MATGSLVLLFFFFFFFFLLLVSSSLGTPCPPCASVPVPYPLSTSPSCGHPSFPILCSPPHLLFHAPSGSYPILSINSSSQTLLLSPPALPPSSCISPDLPSGGFLLSPSLPFSVTPSNSLLLFNCSKLLLQSPLNCSRISPCREAIASESPACNRSLCCFIPTAAPSNAYSIPLNESVCNAYSSVVGFDASLPARDWSFGVELKWSTPSEPPCAYQSQCPSHSVCAASNANANLTCLCNSGYRWDPLSGGCEKGPSKGKAAIIAGVTSSFCAAVLAILLTAAICKRRRAIHEAQAKLTRERSVILSANGAKAALYTGRDIKKATNGFAKERLLGSGAFGDVYKGIFGDGTVVAIKVAKVGNAKGNEQVLNEVRILSQVNHRNLVKLMGCCVETEQPVMVYEYVPNGTLFEHLGGKRGELLDWKTRLAVSVQTAEGLAYLHSSAYPPIIHRDVKSSNILLDNSMTAKVSDFGLSRLAEPDLTHVSTCAQGTLGYLDPEYYKNYQLTDKSDVYSFGVVLLELVTAQRAIDFSREQDDVNLVMYVHERAARGTLEEIFDPGVVETASEAVICSLRAVTFLALDCLQESRAERPRMKEVAEQLQGILTQEAAAEAETYASHLLS